MLEGEIRPLEDHAMSVNNQHAGFHGNDRACAKLSRARNIRNQPDGFFPALQRESSSEGFLPVAGIEYVETANDER
jgi:hypothetical protein